jgi:hypothetical protein
MSLSFEDEDLPVDPKVRHFKEVLSRRTEDQKIDLLHEAFDNLRTEFNG